MAYIGGYKTGFNSGFRQSPLTGGATLATVAALSYSKSTYRNFRVAKRWGVDDTVALDWIRQAQEAGYDVTRPKKEKRR